MVSTVASGEVREKPRYTNIRIESVRENGKSLNYNGFLRPFPALLKALMAVLPSFYTAKSIV
jgi:hypothetical protein